jgi:hypothetical protein
MRVSRRSFVMGSTALALSAPATIGRAQSDAIKFASILYAICDAGGGGRQGSYRSRRDHLRLA